MMKKMIKLKDPIGPDKPLPSFTAQFETAIPSHIAALPIVATKAPVYQQFWYQGNHHLFAAVSMVTTRSTVEILTREKIEGKINILTYY